MWSFESGEWSFSGERINKMDSVIQWATSVCICSGIVCIIEMLLSDTALEKNVRFVLGALMLCAVIVPLGNVIGDFSRDFGNVGESSTNIPETIARQRVDYLKQEIQALSKQYLEQENIYPIGIDVNMDIDDTNCISIITAEVTLNRSDREQSVNVQRIFADRLGMECKIIISE